MWKSIHAKIILLLIIGAGCLCAVGGISIFVDRYKSHQMEIAGQSQLLALLVTESMMLQEQFMTTNDSTILQDISATQESIQYTLHDIQQQVRTDEAKALVDRLVGAYTNRVRLFGVVQEKKALIHRMMDELDTVNKAINADIREMIRMIDQQEARQTGQGERLSYNESTLRDLLNSLLGFQASRSLALQLLSANRDIDAFQNKRKPSGNEKKIEYAIIISSNEEYAHRWKHTVALGKQWDELEATIANELHVNNLLMVTLAENRGQIQGMTRQLTALSRTNIDHTTSISRIVVIVVFGCGTLFLVSIGIFIIRSARRSLQMLTNGFKSLVVGEGDLTKRLTISSRDELGTLARLFNAFLGKHQQLVAQIQRSGIQVFSSTAELSAMAKQQEATIMTQVESTHRVVESSRDISHVTAALVETMQHVMSMSQKAAEWAGNGQKNLKHMAKAMTQMEKASMLISQRLDTIHEKTKNITTVVSTITKVADQTNLLSLNAAIEAEKAGEYGRGFAVVAREIRRLADQTAMATLDIEQMVQDMQSTVSTGVGEIERFITDVRQGTEDVEKIGTQLTQIIEQVQALAPNFEQVNSGMEHQAENAERINMAIVHLSEEMEQTRNSVHETYSAIELLNEAAQGLQSEVSRFKVT